VGKSKAKSSGDCSTSFDIEVSRETVEKAFEEVYAEIVKAANIPGFRAGKAPLDMVKKHYASHAKEEVLKRIVPESYGEALREHKIHPIGMPEITDIIFEDGKPLSFKAKVETHPVFKLKDYKGIKIEKKKLVVKDEDVASALQNLRELNSKYMTVDNRPAQLGDYVVSDLECTVDDKPIHKKRENLWVLLDKDSLVPGLHEKIAGMNKGEEKDIDVVLPEKYPDKLVAGKAARYHVKVKEIKERIPPNLDDELAKDLHRESLDALKKEIATELEHRTRLSIEVDMENQILTKLVDGYDFLLPAGLVKRQLAYMVEDAKEKLVQKGFTRPELDKKDKEFEEKFKSDAAKRVRLLFILDEIARKENIDATDEDVAGAYKAIALQTNQAEDKVKEYYEKEEAVDSLKEKLREDKTIKFLLKEAAVTEKG